MKVIYFFMSELWWFVFFKEYFHFVKFTGIKSNSQFHPYDPFNVCRMCSDALFYIPDSSISVSVLSHR